MYAWINVTNAATRVGSEDFVANRVLAKKGEGAVWIEVGWAEVGWLSDVSGYPARVVYVWDTVAKQWFFYDILTTGDHIDVRIIKSSSCDIGDPSCTYHAQQWNHSTGAWQTLRSVTLPMDRMYVEAYTEVYQDPDWAFTHMNIDIPDNSLDWILTQRRFADGSWLNWGTPNTVIQNNSPYCNSWINSYYKRYVYKGTC